MFAVEWEPKAVIVRFTGGVFNNDLFSSYQVVNNDPRFDHVRYLVSDFTRIDSVQFCTEDVEKMYHLNTAAAKSNANIRQIVATSDEGVEAMTQYFISLTDESLPWSTKLVKTMAEARKIMLSTESNRAFPRQAYSN